MCSSFCSMFSRLFVLSNETYKLYSIAVLLRDHDKRNQGTWLSTDVNSLPSKYFQSMIGRISDCRRPCFLKTQKYRQFFSQREAYSTYWQRKEIYILRNTFRLVASEVTPTEVWCIRSRPAESQLYLPVHLFTLQNDFMSEVAHSGASSSPTSSSSTSRPSTMLVT